LIPGGSSDGSAATISLGNSLDLGSLVQVGNTGNTLSTGYGKKKYFLADINASNLNNNMLGSTLGTRIVLKSPGGGLRGSRRVVVVQQ
ncbi:hypothetical protein OESDEN_18685, partial [Oesophagostomum dentatum]